MFDDPNNPLGAETWQRGMLLGGALVFLFSMGALVVFVFLILLGTATKNALIVAMLLGPIIGGMMFAAYWMVKRPKITTIPFPPDTEDEQDET